jgi:uncharacterized protein
MIRRTFQPFHLMIKPAGAACNLSCDYCFYLEKSRLYQDKQTRMDNETLERFTQAYLKANPAEEIVFGWQGGEPLLMGHEFFEHALELQAKYCLPGQRIVNALQTNGTLIDDKWAELFRKHNFLIGISIDGPADLHDKYRRDRGGKPTHARTIAGLKCLQKHGVEHNALATVNRANVEQPLKVYRYLKDLGLEYLQFIPVVERESPASRKVTPWTVRPEHYGEFLCKIFDHWARNDVGSIFIQIFESALNVWMGNPPSLCVFAPTCGFALAMEHNGDLYACDHFVYPEYFRGNVTPENLASLVEGEAQAEFGRSKADVSRECVECPVIQLCGGDCPKHRLRTAEDGKFLSYLCSAYKRFFTHSAPIFKAMAAEIRAGYPAESVMEMLRMAEGNKH